jgi:outer membrane PBP1 activator LpoA protein
MPRILAVLVAALLSAPCATFASDQDDIVDEAPARSQRFS